MKFKAFKEYLNRNIIGRIFVRIGSYIHTIFLIIKFVFYREMRRLGFSHNKLQKIKNFRNIHKNKRCFIVATGPSLKVSDVEKLNDEITFSMNSICDIFDKTDWRPTYYGIQDKAAIDKVEKNIFNENDSIYFFNNKFKKYILNNRKFIQNKEVVFFPLKYGLHGSRLDFKNNTNGFSNDIYLEVIDGYTITYSLIQIAVYMGINEIYLLGVDNSYSQPGPKHFVNYEEDKLIELKRWELMDKRMELAYKEAQKYANSNNIKIYNATRGGELEVFKRVDFDKIIQ
jgi:hypothetical protein